MFPNRLKGQSRTTQHKFSYNLRAYFLRCASNFYVGMSYEIQARRSNEAMHESSAGYLLGPFFVLILRYDGSIIGSSWVYEKILRCKRSSSMSSVKQTIPIRLRHGVQLIFTDLQLLFNGTLILLETLLLCAKKMRHVNLHTQTRA